MKRDDRLRIPLLVRQGDPRPGPDLDELRRAAEPEDPGVRDHVWTAYKIAALLG